MSFGTDRWRFIHGGKKGSGPLSVQEILNYKAKAHAGAEASPPEMG